MVGNREKRIRAAADRLSALHPSASYERMAQEALDAADAAGSRRCEHDWRVTDIDSLGSIFWRCALCSLEGST